MSQNPSRRPRGYQPPDPIEVPPLYAWPPRPVAAIRWLTTQMLVPWGFVFLGLAMASWFFFTPSMESMATWSVDWVGLIWLRNAVLLTLVAGGLHWWLYMRKTQGMTRKFNPQWLATDDRKFLWRNQARDNVFWSVVSGCTIWSLYESVTLWLYASGRMPVLSIAEAPVYFGVMIWAVFFWSTFHFYFVHRALHWPPLYNLAHELHHRNVNTGPWTGISMHPVEHLLYFSVFMLWWVVPVHPVIIVLTGFFQGLSPAISHSGFERVQLVGTARVGAGDYFHHLHHKHFHFNYGNTPTPVDKLFGSWHDGTAESMARMKERLRTLRRDRLAS